MNNTYSLIIPTYNRPTLLLHTLRSIERQVIVDLAHMEVLVIDDGSNDETGVACRDYINQSQLNIKYTYVKDEGFRAGRARNIGLQLSTMDTVVFVDSGVYLDKYFLAKLNDRRMSENDIYTCATYGFHYHGITKLENSHFELLINTPEYFIENKLHHHYADVREDIFQSLAADMDNLVCPWLLAWTCLLAVPKKLAKQVGGFDDYFQTWGGEDIEFALRLQSAGGMFHWIKESFGIHIPHSRDSEQELEATGIDNYAYIHRKHNLLSTYLLSKGRLTEIEFWLKRFFGGDHPLTHEKQRKLDFFLRAPQCVAKPSLEGNIT